MMLENSLETAEMNDNKPRALTLASAKRRTH